MKTMEEKGRRLLYAERAQRRGRRCHASAYKNIGRLNKLPGLESSGNETRKRSDCLCCRVEWEMTRWRILSGFMGTRKNRCCNLLPKRTTSNNIVSAAPTGTRKSNRRGERGDFAYMIINNYVARVNFPFRVNCIARFTYKNYRLIYAYIYKGKKEAIL